MASQFKAFGVWWPKTVDPVSMHLDCIKAGGSWLNKYSGEQAGGGMEFHYKQVIHLLWPDVVFHKWFDLILEKYLKHRTIAILGPASSGKTFTAALLVLVDYFAHPSDTTVICCSTTKERLEDRVWGVIKNHFKSAKAERKWIPGNIIEGRLRIVTDSRTDSPDGRDFRNGCFPTGTLVDTPNGPVPIEKLKVGDEVFNACGIGKINGIHTRFADKLLMITLSDGRQFACTDEHPILTKRGWIKALDLETSDMVLSRHETVPIMRDYDSEQQGLLLPGMYRKKAMSRMRKTDRTGMARKKFLLSAMQDIFPTKSLRSMRKNVQTTETFGALESCEVGTQDSEILQHNMRWTLGVPTPGSILDQNRQVQAVRENDDWRSFLSTILFKEMQGHAGNKTMLAMRKTVHFDSGITQETEKPVLQSIMSVHSKWENQFQESETTNFTRTSDFGFVPNGRISLPSLHRQTLPEETGSLSRSLVRVGHRVSGNQTSRGSGRTYSFDTCKSRARQTTNQTTQLARVDRIEVLEQGSGTEFEQSSEGYRVHNLSVDGHPSYSVNGVIVHNCIGVPCKRGETFIGISEFAGIKNKRVRLLGDELSMLPKAFVDSISNLDKNPDFKCIGLGNPKDTTDALGVLAEPSVELGGWESGIDQSFGTKTWPTRREGGIAIQLPGDDSPNLDGKLGIPLISQADINRDISFYGKDSIWFTMMDQGRFPRGQGSRRVLTRQLCMKFHATDEPVWRDTNLKRVAFLDAAYRGVGGDRCVFGELVWGYEAVTQKAFVAESSIANSVAFNPQNHQIIALVDTTVVPINPALDVLPEDQIVKFVMDQCTARGIPPQNFFFDSGMRTSLVSAFSRVWDVGVQSVDCGGTAGEEPVSHNITKSCKDYYFNFISQLWFSVRLAVESGQFRGMTDDVMMEFCEREWMIVGANKIQVEPKRKMKEKCGRSPDLADAVAVGIFGARQRGFQIARLEPDKPLRRGRDWRDELRDKSKKIWQTGQLEHASG